MNPSEKDRCTRCGAVIPPKSTEKLCPACLMSGALELNGGEAETLSRVPDKAVSLSQFLEFPSEFGHYRLLGLLGSGGMGAVYEAEEFKTGRRVALKMLAQQLDSPDLQQRFLREGRLAAGVSHPNSLYVFGTEEIEGVPVITMEIAAGGTLEDKLKKRGPLPVKEAVDAILDVVSGLEAAFAAGVLHRDVKPSNCFVSPDGSVKVGDFGLSVSTLAREDTYVTATGVVMGTPAYASPEQLRGDELDMCADIYSVGATLFTLLTGQAPFQGKNAVEVVSNVVSKKPKALAELREDVPPELARVVNRCLAKKPAGRYGDYMTLRNALLPFSSGEPEPASMKVRASAGWIDYLAAFLIPYVIAMFSIGNAEFHFGFLMERTLYSARYYIFVLSVGLLYFTIAEGIWGAGFGKRLKGLRVVRKNGRSPGIGRALIRILIPIGLIEGVRVPLLLGSISATRINDLTIPEILIYSVATATCPWIPALLAMRASRRSGFATLWDLASGTRVVIRPKGIARPAIEPMARAQISAEALPLLGPFQITQELIPGKWIVARDPVLRRQVWLLRRKSAGPSFARRNLARPGRLRWLQSVEMNEATWDAFEAVQGVPFPSLIEGGRRIPWSPLRLWLHDLASELWRATRDQTLPDQLSLDHVWISTHGNALLLDESWPDVKTPAAAIPVQDVAGQQHFLKTVAACVESTSLPLHARPLLQNLRNGTFEKLSFLTGTLGGMLDKPSEVSSGLRAGSIFLLPLYVWVMVFVGTFRGADWLYRMTGDSVASLAMTTGILVLGGCAVIQLMALPLRTTFGHSIFRLAVVGFQGQRAGVLRLLGRWAIVWVPLFVPIFLFVLFLSWDGPTTAFVFLWLLLWIGAAVYAVMHPSRGLQDRLAGTWVVRC